MEISKQQVILILICRKGNVKSISLPINPILKLNHFAIGPKENSNRRKAINKVLMSLRQILKCHKHNNFKHFH